MTRPLIGITSSPIVHDDLPRESLTTSFVDAVVSAGGAPVVLPVVDAALAGRLLDAVEGLLLSGGGDLDPASYGEEPVAEVYGVDPARDRLELACVHEALDRGVPVLGVCRGCQTLNVALGGTLVQHLPTHDVDHLQKERGGEVIHPVDVVPGTRLAGVVGAGTLGVNTLHHQAVARPGGGLRVSAWSEHGVVEAVEAGDDRPLLGVQWHPELLQDHAPHRHLFEWLVDRAERRAA